MNGGSIMTGQEHLFTTKNYLLLALDPVHVGAGGYRLGRVDNTIIREPATGLPKLPGTGLAGVARTYTAMAVQAENQSPGGKIFPFRKPLLNGQGTPVIDAQGKFVFAPDKFDSCAGKGGAKGEKHCGRENCPVCMAFGFSKDNNSFQGLVIFSDAHILLFPVTSMQGPVWITSPTALRQFAGDCPQAMWDTLTYSDLRPEPDQIATVRVAQDDRLNLGWLMFKNQKAEQPLRFSEKSPLTEEILRRTVLVSDDLFPQLVNDNLEVRTSVAIDPATGAADEGALYTYEALPRSTVLWFPVRYQEPAHFQPSSTKVQFTREQLITEVEKGLGLMAVLGVGGKGSRGMGRLKCLNMGKEASHG